MLLGLVGIIAGFFIAFDFFTQWEPRLKNISSIIEKYAKYLGFVAIFMGIWRFFGPELTETSSHYQASKLVLDSQPFIGDLFPSLFAFLGGLALCPQIFQLFNMKDETREKVTSFLDKSKLFLGIGNIVLGLIHLLIRNTALF